MKGFIVTLRVFLCALLVVSFVVPVQATDEEFGSDLSEIDREKIIDFLNIETPDGKRNGDLFHLFPDSFPHGGTEYNGGVDPMFVQINNNNNTISRLKFNYWVSMYDEETGIYVDGWFSPELCGVLDMAGTSLRELDCGRHFESGSCYNTKIEGFIASDCDNLELLNVVHQLMCTEVVAVNCPNLAEVEISESPCRRIEIQPGIYEQPVDITIMGRGSLELLYNAEQSGECTITAVGEEADFIGWLIDGEFIETNNLSIAVAEGCDVVACFAGDVDGDGTITVVDATLTMRSAIFGDRDNLASQDIDADGIISISDAITIARVALGLH